MSSISSNEKQFKSASSSPFELLLKKQLWAPFLIGIGAYMFFLFPSKFTETGNMKFVFSSVCLLVILAGIIMMFVQLKSDANYAATISAEIGDSEPQQAILQLSKNYEILRTQTTQGFILAGVFMTMGILVILIGSAGMMFGFAEKNSNLTTIAGVIMEFISGTSLLIYRINFRQLNETSEKLYNTWRILTAHRLAESLPDERKADATLKLIEALTAK